MSDLTRSMSCGFTGSMSDDLNDLIILGYTISGLQFDNGPVINRKVIIKREPGTNYVANEETVFVIVTQEGELFSTEIPLTAASLKDSYWSYWPGLGYVIVYKEAEPEPVLDQIDVLPEREMTLKGVFDPEERMFFPVEKIKLLPAEMWSSIPVDELEMKFIPILKHDDSTRSYFRVTFEEYIESEFIIKSLEDDFDNGYFIEVGSAQP